MIQFLFVLNRQTETNKFQPFMLSQKHHNDILNAQDLPFNQIPAQIQIQVLQDSKEKMEEAKHSQQLRFKPTQQSSQHSDRIILFDRIRVLMFVTLTAKFILIAYLIYAEQLLGKIKLNQLIVIALSFAFLSLVIVVQIVFIRRKYVSAIQDSKLQTLDCHELSKQQIYEKAKLNLQLFQQNNQKNKQIKIIQSSLFVLRVLIGIDLFSSLLMTLLFFVLWEINEWNNLNVGIQATIFALSIAIITLTTRINKVISVFLDKFQKQKVIVTEIDDNQIRHNEKFRSFQASRKIIEEESMKCHIGQEFKFSIQVKQANDQNHIEQIRQKCSTQTNHLKQDQKLKNQVENLFIIKIENIQ